MATVRFVVLTVKNRTCLVSFMMLFVSYMVLIQYMFIECMFLFICCMFPVYVCLFSYFLQSCCFCPCWSLRPRFKWGHSPFSRPSQGVGKVEEEMAWFAARRRVAWFVEQSSHLFYFLDKKVALNKEPLIYIKWGTSQIHFEGFVQHQHWDFTTSTCGTGELWKPILVRRKMGWYTAQMYPFMSILVWKAMLIQWVSDTLFSIKPKSGVLQGESTTKTTHSLSEWPSHGSEVLLF